MKIERVEDKFKPITITIESQVELDQLVAFANWCHFQEDDDITEIIYDELSQLIENTYDFDETNGKFSLADA